VLIWPCLLSSVFGWFIGNKKGGQGHLKHS
jgi:hypothetical protein